MQRLIFSLILHHVDQFYNNKKTRQIIVTQARRNISNQARTSLGSKCTLPSSDSHGTAVKRQLQPEFKFPAKTPKPQNPKTPSGGFC